MSTVIWAAPATPARDIKILATTVPTTGWDTDGLRAGWTTGPLTPTAIDTGRPTTGWITTSPNH